MTAAPDLGNPVEWYVADRHGRVIVKDQQEMWRPFFKAHAKRPGANRTACGLPALGWHMFWEMPFSMTDVKACLSCRLEVARRAGAGVSFAHERERDRAG